jgi:hypothetical protein
MSAITRTDGQSPNAAGARLVHMRSHGGHRQEYQELFAALFDLSPSTGRVGPTNLRRLVAARAMLFGTIDDDYAGFFMTALLRALLGRSTVGLFLRPQVCLQSKALRNRVKKAAFAFLKRVRPVSVFTIVPFSIAPEFAQVADDGLVDPQLWDLAKTPAGAIDAEFSVHIAAAAGGRRILAFVGTASPIKGIGLLRDLIADPNWPSDELFVVAAGRFPDGNGASADEFAALGALALPRFISDAELQALYAGADLIWACYRPDYDQASGIFGRAVQTGRTPVLRAGSLIARFARQNDISAVELDCAAPPQERLSALTEQVAAAQKAMVPEEKIAQWKQEFIAKLRVAL